MRGVAADTRVVDYSSFAGACLLLRHSASGDCRRHGRDARERTPRPAFNGWRYQQLGDDLLSGVVDQ
jgi:hypothetical protein